MGLSLREAVGKNNSQKLNMKYVEVRTNEFLISSERRKNSAQGHLNSFNQDFMLTLPIRNIRNILVQEIRISFE